MDSMLYREMLEATRLTRAGRLSEATALLQRILRGTAPDPANETARESADTPPTDQPRIIDVTPDVIDGIRHQPSSAAGRASGPAPSSPGKAMTGAGVRPYLPGALRNLLER